MDTKKKTIYIGSGVIVLVIIIAAGFFLLRDKTPNAEDIWQSYVEHLQKQDFDSMYDMLSTSAKDRISKEDFDKRNQRIYEGIDAQNIELSNVESTDSDADKSVQFTISMDTLAGKYSEDNQVNMVKEDSTYKIDWSSSLIFKDLGDEDSINVTSTPAKRGNILDRSDNVLATIGKVMQIGIVPGNMENKEATIKDLASRLSISEDTINKALNASWVKDDLFVPIKTIAYNEEDRDKFSDLKGVQVKVAQDRVYPYGEACAHITGYIQNITAEELDKHAGEGYNQNSIIGKSGLEAIYEKELRGQDGYRISIKNDSSDATLLETDAKDGTNIKTTIDINVQNKLYEKIKNDAGAAVAMNPKTGEMLAMVSTPAYNPNDFVLGMSEDAWNAINNDENQPLRNRFISAYTPGSTFKAITGAIGLETKTISADTEYKKVENWKWQKDSSWGDYFVPTTHEYSEPSNLEYAMVYSDNIFFAQLADQIGTDKFTSYLKQLGFEEKMDFPYTIEPSTYGSADDIKNEMTLSVSGFGQGKLQVSPVHLTDMYTAFVNDGNVVMPYLIYEDGAAKIWKKQVFSAENAKMMRDDLIQAMNKYGANPTKAGAKTGTAEIGDKEIGWITGIRDDIALTIMIDDTSTRGGSAYNIPLLQQVLNELP